MKKCLCLLPEIAVIPIQGSQQFDSFRKAVTKRHTTHGTTFNHENNHCVIAAINGVVRVLPDDGCVGQKWKCLASCSLYHCSTTIVNELCTLGEDQPSWRECLSTHLMPLYLVTQLPDGQMEVHQRVLPESPPVQTRTSAANKVSNIGGAWKKQNPRTMKNWYWL